MRIRSFLLCVVCGGALLSCTATRDTSHFDVDAAIDRCHSQVERALRQLSAMGDTAARMMPRSVNMAAGDTAWTCRPVCPEEWCSGFWPGILWLDYSLRPTPGVRRAAISSTLAVARLLDKPVFDHDIGFLLLCSAGTGWRTLQKELDGGGLPRRQRLEDEMLKERFRQFCWRAADSLSTLFRPRVGTFLSWPRNVDLFGGHNTIIDNMVNLELLCQAANSGGRREWLEMARSHTHTTMKHQFRPDNTVFHVAVYDTLDGHFIRGVTHQGLADSSVWSRGQAWAIYGFTLMADATSSDAFLRQACKAAEAMIARLPEDAVPYWDFSDPRIATSPDCPAAPSDSVAPRDASAAAITAKALIDLSALVTDRQKAGLYMDTARRILVSLAGDNYQAWRHNSAFLLHSTGNLPAGYEIDVPIVYADYYYLAALAAYKQAAESTK